MKVLSQTGIEEIEGHLVRLGAGNHPDNLNRLMRFEFHCTIALAEQDFLGLVVLQNGEVLPISPRGYDRTLRAVAERAIKLGQPKLSNNWDLEANLQRMREKLGRENILRERLVICESRNGEERFGPFYLQDGSHRALAYATLILLGEAQYEEQVAFCSMSESLHNLLSMR